MVEPSKWVRVYVMYDDTKQLKKSWLLGRMYILRVYFTVTVPVCNIYLHTIRKVPQINQNSLELKTILYYYYLQKLKFKH